MLPGERKAGERKKGRRERERKKKERKKKEKNFPALYYVLAFNDVLQASWFGCGLTRTRFSSLEVLALIKIDLLRPLNFGATKAGNI